MMPKPKYKTLISIFLCALPHYIDAVYVVVYVINVVNNRILTQSTLNFSHRHSDIMSTEIGSLPIKDR